MMASNLLQETKRGLKIYRAIPWQIPSIFPRGICPNGFAPPSGGNLVEDLTYRSKDPGSPGALALRRAAECAKSRAAAIAEGLGVTVVRILSAEEITSGDEGFGLAKKVPPPPLPDAVPMPAPLETGIVEISAGVLLRVEIAQ